MSGQVQLKEGERRWWSGGGESFVGRGVVCCAVGAELKGCVCGVYVW